MIFDLETCRTTGGKKDNKPAIQSAYHAMGVNCGCVGISAGNVRFFFVLG